MKGFHWIHRSYPRNFIFSKPLAGAALISLFSFLFLVLYQPGDTHPGYHFGYVATMAIYCFFVGLSVLIATLIIRRIPFFSIKKEWTAGKEILAIFISLIVVGLSIYLAAFMVEPPADRWNLATLLNSFRHGFLIGIIPFGFFSLVYARIWFATEYILVKKDSMTETGGVDHESVIQISSQLKKENLSFPSSKFIYAESDGNYINFFIDENNRVVKKMIRNSMNNVEEDLAHIDHIIRVHRAFLVNLKKVRMKKGNTLGYQLKLEGVDKEVPVSRNKTNEFNQLVKKLS